MHDNTKVKKMLTKLESGIEKLGENFNKELSIVKSQTDLKSTMIEMNNTLEGINSR